MDQELRQEIEIKIEEEHESYLEYNQRNWPPSPHWEKMNSLNPIQALFLSYDIEPPGENGFGWIGNFEQFLQLGDIDRIWDLMRDAMSSGDLCYSRSGYDCLISKQDFIDWLIRKKLSVPKIFDPEMHEILLMPEQVQDVLNLNLDALSSRVLRALGVNVIAQARKRKDNKRGVATKISEVMNSKVMEGFLNDCLVNEGTENCDESTLRKLIQHQFKEK